MHQCKLQDKADDIGGETGKFANQTLPYPTWIYINANTLTQHLPTYLPSIKDSHCFMSGHITVALAVATAVYIHNS